MRYRILTATGLDLARSFLTERKGIPDLSQYEEVIGSGDPLDESVLQTVASRIRKEQTKLAKGKLSAEELDRLCFDLLHSSLPRDELMLSDMVFWSRFAIKYLFDVIYVRFPGRNGKMNLDNFGLGSRKECWPYKLWVRGELAYDPRATDKYELGRVGSIDVWTSHVHRQNFMSIKPMLRSVFDFQYPRRLKGKPYLWEGEEEPKKGGVPGVRTLIKRLSENWASVEYCALSETEAANLVQIHSKGLHLANDKSLHTTP